MKLYTVREACEVLGVPLKPIPHVTAAATPLEAPEDLPRAVREALARDTGDRSVDTARIVNVCHSSGLTLEQARAAVNTRPDLAARLKSRSDDDVQTIWLKAVDNSQATTKASSSSRPRRARRRRPGGAAEFIDPHDGLLVKDLADAVLDDIHCGWGVHDERLYIYRDGVWTADTEGRIEKAIADKLGNQYREAHGRNTRAMIRYSPRTPRITCDPQPRHVNLLNGMWDWKQQVLQPHSPDYLSTTQIPVTYDADADCPEFQAFIEQVLPADCYEPTADSPGFIWELIGYALYSGNPLHIAILLYGKGRNGKGTLIRVLHDMLGARNCSTATLHELVENRFRAATLFGKLANPAGDLDSTFLKNTALFKAITGGDQIQGEHKYGAAFEFTPWALPIYSTNRAFGSSDSSEGWVARWVVVPFPAEFLGREDRNLDARLHTDSELAGIVRRGLAALPVLMARGRLPEPASVLAAKQQFVDASDTVRAWLASTYRIGSVGDWTSRRDIRNAYGRHCVAMGDKPITSQALYNRIEQIAGVTARTRQGDRGFTGIGPLEASDKEDQVQKVQKEQPFPPLIAPRGKKGTNSAPSAPSDLFIQVSAESEGAGVLSQLFNEPVHTCGRCCTPLDNPNLITCPDRVGCDERIERNIR